MYGGSFCYAGDEDCFLDRSSSLILERLKLLHPHRIDLSLVRMRRLLLTLGSPERRLAPVIHVAGTNGKGSTIAFLSSMAAQAGLIAHVYTSPHLVHFSERIVLGTDQASPSPISEERLCRLLDTVVDANAGREITFFEATTAVAFLAFAEVPADLVILETGMGGRLDATNVIERPAATVVTPISHDHMEFLGTSLSEIAREKAGILKSGVPCVVGPQPPAVLQVIRSRAAELGVPLAIWGEDFSATESDGRLYYSSRLDKLDIAQPALRGAHQVVNAGVAIAVAGIAFDGCIQRAEIEGGIAEWSWRARLEVLGSGALLSYVSVGTEVVLDGCHNPGGARATATALHSWPECPARELHLIWGMIEGKDAHGVISAFRGLASRVYTVAIPGEEASFAPDKLAEIASNQGFVASAARGLPHALMLSKIAACGPVRVLIMGSLYLAGEAIKLNEQGCVRAV